MSVNEVKLKQAVEAFVVRGTGPPNSRTFCIGDEDHTLGNALRHVLIQNEQVGFAGYSVPHPSEPVVQLRVQTITPKNKRSDTDDQPVAEPPTAIQTLNVACQTLHDQCDIVLEKLEDLFPEVKEDRIRMEEILLDEGEDEEEDMEVEETEIKAEHS